MLGAGRPKHSADRQGTAYESLLRSRRQVLHQRIAVTLRDRFPTIAETEPALIAHHFTQAGQTQEGIEWWSKAGDQARRRFAFAEAIAHLRKAVDLADGLPDEPEWRLVRLRLQIAWPLGEIDRARRIADDLVARAKRIIKLSMDVIRVPLDTYIFPTLSEAEMTSFPITPLRSAIRLAPAWAKQPVNAPPSSWRVLALPLLHFRDQQTSPRKAISAPVRVLPGSP
jgi:hypothetical protein